MLVNGQRSQYDLQAYIDYVEYIYMKIMYLQCLVGLLYLFQITSCVGGPKSATHIHYFPSTFVWASHWPITLFPSFSFSNMAILFNFFIIFN